MDLHLTEAELLAKDHFLNLVQVGRHIPISDQHEGWNFEFAKPPWFNPDKYELGRQYFHENQMGVLMTNFIGLILLLSVPSGLRILHGTGKSSTPATARDRYVDTILHTVSWYNYPLDNSTKSWESLKMVRKMHLHASYTSMQKNIGHISQMEVSMTTFGFAGFVLIRPHLFGIDTSDQAKREGFLHFWGVLNYMLGVRDEFNIGLLPLEAAEIEFDIIMRHVLAPYVQLECDLFKLMVTALIDGLKAYMPLVEYDSMLFLTRRAVGVPGYQLKVDLEKEMPHRNIFTDEAIRNLNVPIFNPNSVKLVKVRNCNGTGKDPGLADNIIEDENNNLRKMEGDLEDRFLQHFELPKGAGLKVKEIPLENFMSSLSDKKYQKLSRTAKFYVTMNLGALGALNNRVGKFLMDQVLALNLKQIRSQQRDRYRSMARG